MHKEEWFLGLQLEAIQQRIQGLHRLMHSPKKPGEGLQNPPLAAQPDLSEEANQAAGPVCESPGVGRSG